MVAICEGEFDLSPLAAAEQQVLRKAMATDPHLRYPTCQEFVQALEESLRSSRPGSGTRARDEAEGSVPPQGKVRWARWAIGVILPCLILACFAIYLLKNQHGKESLAPGIVIENPLPVEVATGKEATFHLRVQRRNFEGKVRIAFEESAMPKGVAVPAREIDEGDLEAHVQVTVTQDAAHGSHKIPFRIDGDSVHAEGKLDLTVLFLPPNFETDGEVVTDGKST